MLVGLMPIRNEDWVLGASLRTALDWCDGLVVLLHSCWDHSADIVADYQRRHPARIVVLREDSGTWDEMEHRQRMLLRARDWGATHIGLVDADEIVTANVLPCLRREIAGLQPAEVLEVPMVPLWRSLDRYRVDPCVWTRSWLTMAFADRGDLTWKPDRHGYQHHRRTPYGEASRVRFAPPGGGGAMHLQFANWRRLRAKHALYKMTDRLRWPDREPVETTDRRYNAALDESGLLLADVPADWWIGRGRDRIALDLEPWHEMEVRRLLREHPTGTFDGLHLFGLEAAP